MGGSVGTFWAATSTSTPAFSGDEAADGWLGGPIVAVDESSSGISMARRGSSQHPNGAWELG